MSGPWEPTALAAIERAVELDVATRRADGSLRTPRVVWHVVVDGQVFIRSVRGTAGAWYRGARRTGVGRIRSGGVTTDVRFVADREHDVAVDAAYRSRYRGGLPANVLTSATAVATTLRLEPV